MGAWPSVVTLGEVLIDFFPLEPGASIEAAATFCRAAGGAPANVAVALSHLGIQAAFIGKIGGDPFGRFLRQTLADERVDVRGLVVAPDAQTPLAFVGTDGRDRGRSFEFYHQGTADTLLHADEVDRELIGNASIFHFGSVTLAAEPSRTATLAAARTAREHGCLVSFDPNVRLELWERAGQARECILEALALVDVVKVSADEVDFLTGASEPARAAQVLRHLGPSLAVVTLGADGCYFDDGTASGYVAAPYVLAVDTLGAGDAFVAGMLTALLDDRQALEAGLHFANAVGAMTTTRLGAIPALPSRAEVDALLASEPA
jgi:fructokinase